ncbi:glucan biosynthesis protein G [Shewanella xiamenensis]|jgi:glucans biosynthesis protein|uniref:Glucans biosynthesis protein G n=1 Tax=Shewanella xiamenensis TaxID=332186 RepID=A0A073KQ31_9GAMM|nr:MULTISPECIES: glucan biosynthesis protein G [Shewanella]PZP34130.1 MAG: glucan biosynthesis protein G [Shewanella oneidensis]ASF14543.1 glucan biosynthesis protein D [Shewanella sp. FDAARGOS_354]KEK28492.1 Glucans biosynthesis protein G1 [Shewanella xiamenensis]KPN75820.1 glucan biosynthesis protein D [Shewanella sp. Sh95]MBW0281436.1 glucan biosynthesis protein D [Shewanella xiamenensis]
MVSLLRCQSFKPSSLICSLALSAAFAFSGTAFADETKPVENKPTTPVVSPPKATAQPANKTQVRFTKTGTFDGETVVKLARKLASKPYVVLKDPLPAGLAKLTYDEYRDIRFNPVSSIWRDQGLPFQMQMFHRGFYFQDLIEIAIVEANQATHLAYEPKYFTAGEVISQALPNDDIGYSGFRIHNQLNTNGIFDELMVFQGASYFRALGKGNSYGLSARGLALKTADPEGEEFPIFRAFWVERPSYDSNLIVVHALLDSPSVAGAYRFSVRPGDNTQIDVEATLFPRVELNKVGLAPSTSMFLHSLNGRHDTDDFRPEVHDSDGLLMFNGRGEHLWRPLANPRQLQVSAFSDNSPQGFGLIQRERNYASYQDLEAQYERRPSLWIEPVGNWGQGAVVLTEIPTESEIHDNIVSFWKPRQPIPAGSEYHFAYRMSWGDEPVAKTNSVVVSRTASGRADIAKATPRRLFVVDYHLNGAMPDELPLAKVESSGGVISNVVIARNAANNGYRLAFELEPEDKDLIELRAELKFSTPRQVETWLYRWTL